MGNMAFDPNLTAQGGNQTYDPHAEAASAVANGQQPFLIGGGLQNIPGSVPPRQHELEENNIERAENKKMMKRRMAGTFYKYPQLLHKVGGMSRLVNNDDECADAVSKGWKEDIRDVEELESKDAPERIFQMTVKQALAHVETHKGDAYKLVEIRADEQTHGKRKVVLDALSAAEDAFGFAGMNARDAKPKTAPKGKK